MLITITLIAFFASLIFAYWWSLKSRYDYFKRRNIPGPPAQFFFGHLLTLWNVPSYTQQIKDWTRQYGSIYGLFEGSRPMYVVSDVDFLQEVYIKQFSSFHSRRENFLTSTVQSESPHLFSANADQWRRQRHVINPTFTALKLKTMTPLITKCIESMMKKLDETNGQEFNIYSMYKRLTMDVIWHCAFGIDTDMQNDVNNVYMKKSMACFAIDAEQTPLVKISKVMPFLTPFLTQLVKTGIASIKTLQKTLPNLFQDRDVLASIWIIEKVEEVVKKRLESGKRRTDLLQLMLDAATDEEIKDDQNEELTSKNLRYTEVVMNVFLFMLAGFETTSTFLAYSTYVLVTNPEVQKKLQDEIDSILQKDDPVMDYETVANMEYMDLFVREVLRMYRTSGKASTRQCNKTTNICGHQIEEGSIILTDVHAVHYNPELWGPEDPNLFVPERHTAKRHPVAYMPFGVGPRNCVGMRFALIELKMGLARVLHTYNILPGDKLEEGMTRRETLMITPNAINIRLERRSD